MFKDASDFEISVPFRASYTFFLMYKMIFCAHLITIKSPSSSLLFCRFLDSTTILTYSSSMKRQLGAAKARFHESIPIEDTGNQQVEKEKHSTDSKFGQPSPWMSGSAELVRNAAIALASSSKRDSPAWKLLFDKVD